MLIEPPPSSVLPQDLPAGPGVAIDIATMTLPVLLRGERWPEGSAARMRSGIAKGVRQWPLHLSVARGSAAELTYTEPPEPAEPQ